MPKMMHVKLSCHRNMMVKNFQLHFLSHTFTDTNWKLSTLEQEVCGIYYVVTEWNYYL